MTTKNITTTETKKMTITDYINSDKVEQQILKVFQNEDKVKQLISSMNSIISKFPALKTCKPDSLVRVFIEAGMDGLDFNPTLQEAHIVPYKIGDDTVAQYQVSFKGYKKIAINSGNVKDIDVFPVRKSQFEGFDMVSKEIKIKNNFESFEDYEKLLTEEVIGYYAYMIFNDGTKKSLFWTNKQINEHHKKYSTAYNSSKDNPNNVFVKSKEAMDAKVVVKKLLRDNLIYFTNNNIPLADVLSKDSAAYIKDKKVYVDNPLYNEQDQRNKEEIYENIDDSWYDRKEILDDGKVKCFKNGIEIECK